VSLLGPPNAGKSTLYNRFLQHSPLRPLGLRSETRGARKRSGPVGSAIVSGVAGTTRDRRQAVGSLGGVGFRLFDTAGVDDDVMAAAGEGEGERKVPGVRRRRRVKEEDIGRENMTKEGVVLRGMARQTLRAAREADVVLLMFDAREVLKGGSVAEIREAARWLRKSLGEGDRRVVLVANKLEGDRFGAAGEEALKEFEKVGRLGFGEPLLISATHGEGLGDLANVLREAAEERGLAAELKAPDAEAPKRINIAFLGRQNVGKSTLLNAIIEEDRCITGSVAGLTRDAIAVDFDYGGVPFSLVDTAGIRKEASRDTRDDIENGALGGVAEGGVVEGGWVEGGGGHNPRGHKPRGGTNRGGPQTTPGS
jgi:GTP-binding protein